MIADEEIDILDYSEDTKETIKRYLRFMQEHKSGITNELKRILEANNASCFVKGDDIFLNIEKELKRISFSCSNELNKLPIIAGLKAETIIANILKSDGAISNNTQFTRSCHANDKSLVFIKKPNHESGISDCASDISYAFDGCSNVLAIDNEVDFSPIYMVATFRNMSCPTTSIRVNLENCTYADNAFYGSTFDIIEIENMSKCNNISLTSMLNGTTANCVKGLNLRHWSHTIGYNRVYSITAGNDNIKDIIFDGNTYMYYGQLGDAYRGESQVVKVIYRILKSLFDYSTEDGFDYSQCPNKQDVTKFKFRNISTSEIAQIKQICLSENNENINAAKEEFLSIKSEVYRRGWSFTDATNTNWIWQ